VKSCDEALLSYDLPKIFKKSASGQKWWLDLRFKKNRPIGGPIGIFFYQN
jgi:hypothetical protein